MEMCTRCNGALAPGYAFCGVCGTARPPSAVAPPPPPPAPYGHPAPVPYGHPAPGTYPVPAAYVVPAYPVYATPVYAQPKSKAVAALLCFFLGGLGVHRFYTGQTGVGLALLLTTLILGPLTLGVWWIVTFVWVMVDFVLILCGGVRDQHGREMVW